MLAFDRHRFVMETDGRADCVFFLQISIHVCAIGNVRENSNSRLYSYLSRESTVAN